ncbi:hypothetical protein [uncultured Croceitalea sp.]|uniref:hypothetical protein n=1 Tax=uncultured Croceitalea sp. TaxID=1798908 RepID=UPI00374F4213
MSGNVLSQNLKKYVEGFIVGKGEFLEGIHLYTNKFESATISDSNGRFNIPANVGDTLYISSINFKNKRIIVNEAIISNPSISISLLEKIYTLDEVVVTPYNLSGSLNSDLDKFSFENQLNSNVLGLPNANVKLMNKSQRALYEATDGKKIFMRGGTGSFGLTLSFNRIINGISGRTKKLKKNVEIESDMIQAEQLKLMFPSTFFNLELGIPSEEIYLFIFFCQNDVRFSKMFDDGDKESLITFLKEKSIDFNKRSFP